MSEVPVQSDVLALSISFESRTNAFEEIEPLRQVGGGENVRIGAIPPHARVGQLQHLLAIDSQPFAHLARGVGTDFWSVFLVHVSIGVLRKSQ